MANLVRVGGGGKKEKNLVIYHGTHSYPSFEIAPYTLMNPQYQTLVVGIDKIYGVATSTGAGSTYIIFSDTYNRNEYSKIRIRYKNTSSINSNIVVLLTGGGDYRQPLPLSSAETEYIYEIPSNVTSFQLQYDNGKMSGCELYGIELIPIEKEFLYKDGTQNVAWDNSGIYRFSESYTGEGGATLGEIDFTLSVPTTAGKNRIFLSNSPINLEGYTKLKGMYAESGTINIKSCDITNFNMGYVFIGVARLNGHTYLEIGVSSTKDLCFTNNLSHIEVLDASGPFRFSRVWLEK